MSQDPPSCLRAQRSTRKVKLAHGKYLSSVWNILHLEFTYHNFYFHSKYRGKTNCRPLRISAPATWEVSILRVHWPPFNSDLWPRFRIQCGAVVAHRSEIMRGCPNGTNRGRFNLISSQSRTSFSNDQREERSTLPSIDSSFLRLSLCPHPRSGIDRRLSGSSVTIAIDEETDGVHSSTYISR